MRSFRLDPYLWVHLAGLAAVPLWLDICLLGLATGEPVLPTWLELALVAGFGILPVAWMQWRRPFCIFSLVFLSLRPDRLSEDRRRLLRLFKDPLVKFVTALAPVPLLWALNKLYMLAPLAADLTPFGLGGRWLGLLVAAIAFLLANLFVQVPLTVVRVLLTPQRVFDQLPPYAPEQVRQDFTLLGIRINQILPDWQALAVVQPVSVASVSDLYSARETVRPEAAEPTAVSESERVFDQVISSDSVSEDDVTGDRDMAAEADLLEAAAEEIATVETVAETIAEAADKAADDERAFDSIDLVQTASAEEIPASEVQLTAPETAEPEPAHAAKVEASLAQTHASESLPPGPAAAAEPEQAAQIPAIAALAETAAEDLEALANEAADAAQPAQLEQLPGDSGAGSEAAAVSAAPLHTVEPAAAGDRHSEQSTRNSHGSHTLPGEPQGIAPPEIAVNPYFDPAAPAEVGDPPPPHPG